MNAFIQALSMIHSIPPAIVTEMEEQLHTATYPKGHELLSIGKVSKKIYFVEEGVARVFYLKSGQDITDYFAMDNQFIGAIESLFTKQPSQKGIETLEPTRLIYMIYDDFEKLCDKYHVIEKIGRKMAIFGFLEGQRRVEAIRFMSAAERYYELERTHPGLTNRIPLKYIASYLGTTQVSVSRIRAGQQ